MLSLSSIPTEDSSLLGWNDEGSSSSSDENGLDGRIVSSRRSRQQPHSRSRNLLTLPLGLLLVVCLVALLSPDLLSSFSSVASTNQNRDTMLSWNTVGSPGSSTGGNNPTSAASGAEDDRSTEAFSYGESSSDIPVVHPRCEWVMEQFRKRDVDYTPEQIEYRDKTQSTDFNVFYRATAHIFWSDFVSGHWGDGLTRSLKEYATLSDGVHLDQMSTYTWVTGDQHLSNFGAFLNRHGDVVFSVNDFDEGAIYDFQVDVLRIAVSVYNHALTNDLSDHDVVKVLETLTDTYVGTVLKYIGNEDALLFELTTKTTTGFLRDFLKEVQSTDSYAKQMKKYTKVDEHGHRSFFKGPVGQPDPSTKLASLPPDREQMIRSVFSATEYGATMMKLGWLVKQWDDDFFTVLDVASRVGSGVGSSGVDRFYVLLKGTDHSLDTYTGKNASNTGTAVVLDVKYEPPGAVTQVLTPEEAAWYSVQFPNDAARAVEAQRRLTSFTDPYTGWVILPDENGVLKSFSVRQRSPWKDSPDLNELTDAHVFSEFIGQIAMATATSHVRGTVGKKPGDFKSVIQALLGSHSNRKKWGQEVAKLAKAYHQQVLLDYGCFASYVKEMYPP